MTASISVGGIGRHIGHIRHWLGTWNSGNAALLLQSKFWGSEHESNRARQRLSTVSVVPVPTKVHLLAAIADIPICSQKETSLHDVGGCACNQVSGSRWFHPHTDWHYASLGMNRLQCSSRRSPSRNNSKPEPGPMTWKPMPAGHRYVLLRKRLFSGHAYGHVLWQACTQVSQLNRYNPVPKWLRRIARAGFTGCGCTPNMDSTMFIKQLQEIPTVSTPGHTVSWITHSWYFGYQERPEKLDTGRSGPAFLENQRTLEGSSRGKSCQSVLWWSLVKTQKNE